MTFLAADANCGAAVQNDFGHQHASDFRHPAACVIERGEHHAISLSTPGGAVRRIEDCLHLSAGEETQQRFVEALHGYRENALDHGQPCRLLECREVEERADCCEARIAATNRVVTVA